MNTLNSLEDLFHHQLKDIYNAEKQLMDALPDLRDQATTQALREAVSDHLDETRGHKKRLDDIAKSLDLELSGETCEAMKGLIEEARSFISEDAKPTVRDAGLIADLQRIQHYEIAAYGTALHYAEALNHTAAVEKLRASLNEEKDADQKLNILAEENINPLAKSA